MKNNMHGCCDEKQPQNRSNRRVMNQYYCEFLYEFGILTPFDNIDKY